MLTQKEDSHLLFQRISYWLRELSFDMEGYVKNYSGFIAREFSNLALYRDDIIEKIIQRASPDDLNIVFKTSPQEILNRLFIPKETEDHLKEDFSPERVKHARLSLLNLGRELLCLPVFNYPAKEIKYSRSDEVIIFLKALPYEVSIPLISIMDLNISSSALKRYYTYHLYNREEEVLKKFFNNYYIKETEDVMSSITAEEKMIENFYPFILQIGVGLLWLVPMLTNSIEVIRKYFFQTKGIIIPDLVISVIPQIHPQYYIINMGGDRVGEGRIIGNKILALGFEKNIRLLEVENCFDPVYSGFIAWIDPHEKEKAYKYGCVVLSPEDIIPDHIIRIMERNLSLVIDANYLKAFFDIIKNSYPLLIKRFNEMNIPGEMTISILRNLVQEGVNIRDMVTILSEILYYRPRTDDVLILTEYVLKAISPLSSYNYVKHPGKKLYSFTLPHEVEEELKTLTQWDELFPEKIPEEKRKSLIDYIENLYILMKANNKKPLMVIDGEIRPYIRQLLSNDFLDLIVLSRDELDKDIELVEEVKPS
ncbi:MAG TPA: FHIPEP family type III secretion protein, partial [Candidatus Eremiobacteraeota bacterium]|nr:FHIPEP family type III secretion protein [Candidatus Eremiobacteraeota bacterium]